MVVSCPAYCPPTDTCVLNYAAPPCVCTVSATPEPEPEPEPVE